jgi:hypothetical protein
MAGTSCGAKKLRINAFPEPHREIGIYEYTHRFFQIVDTMWGN